MAADPAASGFADFAVRLSTSGARCCVHPEGSPSSCHHADSPSSSCSPMTLCDSSCWPTQYDLSPLRRQRRS
jgi:hypothetical protein